MIFATIEPPEDLPTTGTGCFLQARYEMSVYFLGSNCDRHVQIIKDDLILSVTSENVTKLSQNRVEIGLLGSTHENTKHKYKRRIL